MVRRIASQVHKTASRLKQAGLIPEPAWFQAVVQHPPLPVPPRSPPPRTSFDTKYKPVKKRIRPHALPVDYLEDKIRRQFFKDHPFEAFRPTSLVEHEQVVPEHPVRDEEWTRLSQRGVNPQPETVIQFAACLRRIHKKRLSLAYDEAVAQFHSLKSEHHIATLIAVQEAEILGAEFGPRETDIGFQKELKQLMTWQKQDELNDEEALAARKRWRTEIPRAGEPGEWTRGEAYVRLWHAGIRPTYLPAQPSTSDPAPSLQ